ncbi:PREDICTED: cytochrome P450 9e2-like [Nicrophorus vespilloides]|uniref:Cytochrome P450 9e2-like n=1 Tax=Nicrophorus vespilloides TaxID=110193 RepID=A0ABM1M6A7_NICVS|nr:PREDICTED: cytochrome P450 9e2-like [Nicrophorus vespilloides]
MLIILLLIIALLLVSWALVRQQLYWKYKNIVQGFPKPVFGDTIGTYLQLQSLTDMVKNIYFSYPKNRYVGFYQMSKPMLMIRDPELIKQLAIKDFEYFSNHINYVPGDSDLFWSNNLFALKGSKWSHMRNILTPAFTSMKIQNMFELIDKLSTQFINFYERKISEEQTIELKDAYTRYANDVLAISVFGVKCDSLVHPTNEFYMMSKDLTNIMSFSRLSKIFLHFLLPTLAKALKFIIIPEKVSAFFLQLISDILRVRKHEGILRHDMLNTLMKAREKDGISISDIEITSNFLIFFSAGIVNTTSLMCFASYELALNPEIQQRVKQEIETVHQKFGKLTYEAVMELKYLDMVLKETIRKWPPGFFLDRRCVKEYTIEPQFPDEVAVHLKPDDVICFPASGLHYDPKYFPNPTKFDPERFSDSNKYSIHPYTYLPFGVGPRSCIAYRFAMMTTKIMFFKLISTFEIVVSEKTCVPLKISKFDLMMTSADGFWLGLKRRYVGFYQMTNPMLMIRDPELIKQLAIKDFEHFSNHINYVPGDNKVSTQFVTFYERKISEKQFIKLKGAYTKYAIDVLAICVFGVKCDSLDYPTNEFYMMIKNVTKISFSGISKMFLHFLLPTLAKAVNFEIIPKKVSAFILRLVGDTLRLNEKKLVYKFPILKLPRISWYSFRPASRTPPVNPDIQERVRKEIEEVHRKFGKFTYESVMELKYFDMVLKETIRKWPPGFLLDRHCVKEYTIEPQFPDEVAVHLKPGDVICFPAAGLHNVPKYFPNPSKFNPERFSDSNKYSIHPCTYLPFGIGPRSCIAYRFAMMIVKIMFFKLLNKFEIVVSEKTSVPLKISKNNLLLTSTDGFWLGLKRRKI